MLKKKKLLFANGDSETAEFRQICQTKNKKTACVGLVKSARNPAEIRNPPEIFFARQTTFKSAKIVQIWQRKLPSGNAALCLSLFTR
jgi:hypothetical protein